MGNTLKIKKKKTIFFLTNFYISYKNIINFFLKWFVNKFRIIIGQLVTTYLILFEELSKYLMIPINLKKKKNT